jgi:hypothetical protein
VYILYDFSVLLAAYCVLHEMCVKELDVCVGIGGIDVLHDVGIIVCTDMLIVVVLIHFI